MLRGSLLGEPYLHDLATVDTDLCNLGANISIFVHLYQTPDKLDHLTLTLNLALPRSLG